MCNDPPAEVQDRGGVGNPNSVVRVPPNVLHLGQVVRAGGVGSGLGGDNDRCARLVEIIGR